METIADACGVSAWEARQWQAASRYRLVRVSTEPADGPLESGLRAKGLRVLIVPDETVVRSRNPIPLESIDQFADPPQYTLREDPEAPASRRTLSEQDLALIVTASIKRERVQELLDRLYPAPAVPLDHVDPYTLLVVWLTRTSVHCAEMMVATRS